MLAFASLFVVGLAAATQTMAQQQIAGVEDAVQTEAQEAAQDEAQDEAQATEPEEVAENAAETIAYVPAIRILPDSVAGLVRMPSVPDFCNAWRKTHFGQLVQDPAVQPFIEAQRDRVIDYFDAIDNRVGLKPDDLYYIASGEAVAAWLPFEKDKRRPFSLVVIADIRGKPQEADDAMATLDADLKAGGASRKDVEHAGQNVRVYKIKPKPGQIKIEQVAITLDDARIIASDRDTVVFDLLDALNGKMAGKPISELADFRDVLTRSSRAMQQPFTEGDSTVAVEWFAHPFQMGRILRETFEVDRGTQIDILNLLERQGFDAIRAAGGIAAIAGKKYDILHRGYILAPPTTKLPSKYEKAARMLQFPNGDLGDLPNWISEDTASVGRFRLKIEEAFLAAESLVDDALGDKIFKPTLDGIREDTDGPQIDILNNVLPALGDEVLLISDNTLPADIQSERLLVAIQVTNPESIKEAIRKAMEVEPDASQLDLVPGVELWQVERGEGADDFEDEIFGDLGFEEEDVEEIDPLLDHWAIGMVPKTEGSDHAYLMFSSHPALLVETVERIQTGIPGGFAQLPEVQEVRSAMEDLEPDSVAMNRIGRSKLGIRTKYELFRQGKLRESDSILATVIRRLFKEEEGVAPEDLDSAKLPPIDQIEKYLPNGGNFTRTEADGWSINGFMLK